MVRNTYTGIESIDSSIIARLRNMVVMTIALAGIASLIGASGLGVAKSH